MMWTLEQIELIASGFAPQSNWHKCDHCKIEYTSMGLAYSCWKSHFRSYERTYSKINTLAVKHEVAYDEGRPLCKQCTKRAEGVLQTVFMTDPPTCSRCKQQIQDPPKAELTPPRRPTSETHREMMLAPARETLVEIERYRITKKLRKVGFTTGHGPMDEENFRDFGPNKPDGQGGTPRATDGYSTIKKSEPLQCKSLNLGPGVSD